MSILDEDGGLYYAFIRGFLQDQYAEKYAVITWLLPRYPNPTHFDPTRFILGVFRIIISIIFRVCGGEGVSLF